MFSVPKDLACKNRTSGAKAAHAQEASGTAKAVPFVKDRLAALAAACPKQQIYATSWAQ